MVITGSLTGMTTGELERVKRDLPVSLALAPEGSPVHVSISRQTALIDAELARRAASPPYDQVYRGDPGPGNPVFRAGGSRRRQRMRSSLHRVLPACTLSPPPGRDNHRRAGRLVRRTGARLTRTAARPR